LATPIRDIIRSVFSLGHNPRSWNTSDVFFLGKPGKLEARDPKSFRPISLTSVMQKLAESLMKKAMLQSNPTLHAKNQHAYQAGSSCESAIHCAVDSIERHINSEVRLRRRVDGKSKQIVAKGVVIAIAIDYSGAFNSLYHAAVYEAMKRENAKELDDQFCPRRQHQ
jgi:hypothetical protein